MQTLRRRLTKSEEGFTLIELMVVVLIIAILIAIAIPTFLGAQDRARDRGAQSDLRNSITAAKTLATDNAGAFLNNDVPPTVIMADDMAAAEPALAAAYTDVAAGVTADDIYVLTAALGADITLMTRSASDTYFGITATDDGVVEYCSDDVLATCQDPANAAYTPEPW
jgi:type IV pilus assembly protein PilA